jgi:hypothetical protein
VTLLLALIVAGLVYSRWQRLEVRHERNQTELVQTEQFNGHEYNLYYKRRDAANVISKDGVTVFDARVHASPAGCIWQLVKDTGSLYRQCHLANGNQTFRERVP